MPFAAVVDSSVPAQAAQAATTQDSVTQDAVTQDAVTQDAVTQATPTHAAIAGLGINEKLGIGTPEPDQNFAHLAQEYWASLDVKLAADWKGQFGALRYAHLDRGATQPISAVPVDNAPECLVARIDSNLRTWGLLTTDPQDTAVAEEIATAMTSQFSAQSHPVGRAFGRVGLSSTGDLSSTSERICWMTWYADFSAAASGIGALFVFTAALG